MNEYIEAIILGIVQGLTEFLPVSSDGHLELAKWLLGNTDSAADSFLMTIILHFGTLFAILWVFRKTIAEWISKMNKPEGWKFAGLIAISMIPAVIVGVAFESEIATLFHQKIILVGIFLLINGSMLILSDHFRPGDKPLNPLRVFLIGIAQAIAILPGISRSGSTIVTSVGLGIDRKEAANFSFLMLIPLLFGKMGKDIVDGNIVFNDAKMLPLFVGFLFAFIVGVFACQWMIAFVKKAKLSYFGYYCVVIGVLAIILRLWVFPA